MKKKKLIIIGGTSGLGLATGKNLSEKGYEVILAGRKEPKISGSAKYKFIDVTDEISVKNFFSSNEITAIDGLIYSAGITVKKTPITDFDISSFKEVNDVNLVGALLCLKYSYNFLKKSQARVVIVNSLAARTYSKFSGFEYTISKSGLCGMVKQLAIEWANDGVLINSIFPSMIDTPMLRENLTQEDFSLISESIPLKRVASTEDIINSIEFLIGSKNTYITGSGIDINGGSYLAS
jgi:NAD(P)-dependent dehydrogenase (short-subunit alcohol dehydrogenase family)